MGLGGWRGPSSPSTASSTRFSPVRMPTTLMEQTRNQVSLALTLLRQPQPSVDRLTDRSPHSPGSQRVPAMPDPGYRLPADLYLDVRHPLLVWFERLGVIRAERAEVVLEPGVLDVLLALAGPKPAVSELPRHELDRPPDPPPASRDPGSMRRIR
jgi:hypothetical protein